MSDRAAGNALPDSLEESTSGFRFNGNSDRGRVSVVTKWTEEMNVWGTSRAKELDGNCHADSYSPAYAAHA